jgi:hypothetical protein
LRLQEVALAEIDDFEHEIELARQNDQLMAFLERRARQSDTIPLDEVKKKLL